MTDPSNVALIYCNDYAFENVEIAVRQGLDLLGGAGQFVRVGEKMLVKPNILVGSDPEKCISPHPAVFKAVLKVFLAAGAALSFGDSPAVGSPRGGARAAKLLHVAEELGVPLADLTTPQTVPFPKGNLIKQFDIAGGVAESDGIISLAKMKSHALTRMTGAIKNQFGCIPGVLKAEFHSRLPNSRLFSQMLVDLTLLLKPRLYIMDGILAMEGNGPRNGTPRPMNVLLFSKDPVALDAAACRMMNLDEELVEPIIYGNKFGLGSSKNIAILGEPLERFIAPDFQVNRRKAPTATEPSLFSHPFMRNTFTPKPVIDVQKCTKCGVCVDMCPAEPKAVAWANGKTEAPIYNYDNCIRCYCCQEVCPQGAISMRTPYLGRLIHR